MAKSVFEQIKERNGERFAKAIRGYDNGIFDIPGIVDIVKYAGHEAEPIMDYLESLKGVKIEENGVYQDPITLLDAAGYDAYYVTNLEEQNAIQKYYAPREALCTFHDPSRFERYHIVNAVRKDVDQIRREDFRGKEKRDDAYGTSVLSIQILKTGGFISIKNRYNHTVSNPDNTLGSNPDLIIPGLANSLRHHFNTDFSAQKVRLPSDFILVNNQIIRYNYEQENVYFGSNFYVKDGVIHHLKDHEIMLGMHVFDMRTKTLSYPAAVKPGAITGEDTEFKRVFLKEIEGHKVILKKDKEGQHLFIRKEGEKDPAKDVEILMVKDGKITALNLPTTTEIRNDFLKHYSGRALKSLSAPRLESMGLRCFYDTPALTSLHLPNLKRMADECFTSLNSLKSLDLPALGTVGYRCFFSALALTSLKLPKLVFMGEQCLLNTWRLESIYLPSLVHMGSESCHGNRLKTVHLPALKSMGYRCICGMGLQSVSLPQVTEMGAGCLCYTESLRSFYAPQMKEKPERFAAYMNPLKRMILWMKRKQLPKDLPVAEAGISAMLEGTQSQGQSSEAGMSRRLKREERAGGQPAPVQRRSFFEKLKDWFLPQK
ncbi:MAG: leucine-rich repeat protein [Alphaproteobacteria bacterium]|nr:leucine-rich repeat protein [Alphaproteobacteria bacterium]